jgi:hypothetical protein
MATAQVVYERHKRSGILPHFARLTITGVGVEKLTLSELAENSLRQDGLQTIFSSGLDISITGFEPVCAENEFFNTLGPMHSLSPTAALLDYFC